MEQHYYWESDDYFSNKEMFLFMVHEMQCRVHISIPKNRHWHYERVFLQSNTVPFRYRLVSFCQNVNTINIKHRVSNSGRSPAEIVGSNPTGGMDFCLLLGLSVDR